MTTITEPASPAERPLTPETVLADFARAVGMLRCAGSQRLVRLGISMNHFHVLTLLRHHDAMPMGRLAEVLDASMSNATGIIDRMEERGLVERVRVTDDRRVVLVRPTQAGLDLVDEVELAKNEVLVAALSRLETARLQRLADAAGDLEAAITIELNSDPDRYAAIAQCTHPRPSHHAPVSGDASHVPAAAGA